jgi:hypothetical protein
MNRVRVKDLALVAAAGGLLAFELVSIGEALPNVRKALAQRGRPERVEVASASVASVSLPSLGPAAPMAPPAPMASPAVAKAAKRHDYMVAERHAHLVVVSSSAGSSKRCVAMARARDARRAHERTRVLRVATDGSCVACAAARIVEKRREIEKAVNPAVKQSTL